MKKILLTLFSVLCVAIVVGSLTNQINLTEPHEVFFYLNQEYNAEGFDFPVGSPNAIGYYNAQKFGKNNHLGDDWNGTGGGNTDLGDDVFSVANGYVSEVYDAGGGWGNIVRIIHKTGQDNYVESLYAHLETMNVKVGEGIKKGALLGAIGNAGGIYWAHLHLEIRNEIGLELGGGYSSNKEGYLDPTKFIEGNRKVMWKKVRSN